MKRIDSILYFCSVALLVAVPSIRAQPPASPPQPVYIFLTASVGDYVNRPISEERLRRTLSAVEKYRKDNASLNATVYFSGAMSDALAQSNSQDHLLDFVRGYIERGAIRPGYDGNDEPTIEHRPMLDFSAAKSTDERWLVRLNSAKDLLTQARDPLTGAPLPGKTGGLKRMQEVFGQAAGIRGVILVLPNLLGPMDETGADPEIVNELRQFNQTAIMAGLPDSNLAEVGGSSFRPWADKFTQAMSPDSNTPPEAFWQEDMLRLSETSRLDAAIFHADDGVAKLKTALAGLDRSRVRILRVELGAQRIYMKPPAPPEIRPMTPLAWAYKHPDSPLYPDSLRNTQATVDARYAQQEEVLKFLVSEYLPANPGSRFISAPDLQSMTKPGWGYDLSVATLQSAVREMLKTWGDQTTPPIYVKAGDRYLSLADLFEVSADVLAQRSRTGSLPATVHVGRVFGPMATSRPLSFVSGQVTTESVAKACAGLINALHDDSWNPTPHNAIPSSVEIENLKVTPAQFLRLMAEALLAPTPQTKLSIKPIEMFAGHIVTYTTRRPLSEMGSPWTLKPAVLGPLAK